MKKTALILISEIPAHKDLILNMCMRDALKAGYMPIVPALYDRTPVDVDEFIDRVISFIDVILIYTNYGINDKILKIIEDTEQRSKIIYRKISGKMTVDLYISPFEILKDVSIRMGIPIEKLKSKTRKREIVDARYIYFRRAKEITKASTTKIGEYVNRHHATVIHGIKETFNVPDLIKKYESIYGKTKIETKTLASCSEEANNSRQGERPVLSHDKMEEGITTVPSGKSVMYALLGQWPCNTRRNCGSQGAEKYMQ